MRTVEFKGKSYTFVPRAVDFIFIGSLPFYYLYTFMEVVRDHITAGTVHKIDDKDYYPTLVDKVREKAEYIKECNKARHDSTMDYIDHYYYQVMAGDRPTMHGDMLRGDVVRRMGDSRQVTALPGSNYDSGLVMFQRVSEYVSITLPPPESCKSNHPHVNGSHYMLVLSDRLVVHVNGKEVNSIPYPGDERTRSFIEEYIEMYDIDKEVFIQPEQHIGAIIDSLWALKPSGGKNWLGYKFLRCVELLRQFECRDNGVEYKPNEIGISSIAIMHVDNELRQAFVKVAHAWVSYLVLKSESGIGEDYIKGFGSWCDEAYEQWKLHDRYHELPDCKVNLQSDKTVSMAGKIRDMMQRMASDVAAMTDERMVDVITMCGLIKTKEI